MGTEAEDNLEFDGYWWIPSKPEQKLSGKLTLSRADGIRLRLLGQFGEDPFVDASTNKIDTINGIGSKLITLVGCNLVESRNTIPGLPSLTYECRFGLVGYHFASEEEAAFDKVTFRIPNLEYWLREQSFAVKHDHSADGSLLSIEELPPKTFVYQAGELELSIALGSHSSFAFFKKAEVTQDCYVKICAGRLLKIHEIVREIIPVFRNLFCVMLRIPAYEESVICYNSALKSESPFASTPLRTAPIEIFWKEPAFKRVSTKDIFSNSLIPFSSVSNMFGDVVANWRKSFSTVSPLYYLYFANQYFPAHFINVQFVNYVQALEAYHRQKYGGNYLEDSAHSRFVEEMRAAIPNGLSPEFRSSFDSRLKYSNEFSLRTRLKKLLATVEPVTNLLIDDTKSFSSFVADARNFFTHHDTTGQSSPDPLRIYLATQQLNVLCAVFLLMEAGIRIEDVVEGIARHPDLQEINSLRQQVSQRP